MVLTAFELVGIGNCTNKTGHILGADLAAQK